jgi:hypothetical protein
MISGFKGFALINDQCSVPHFKNRLIQKIGNNNNDAQL